MPIMTIGWREALIVSRPVCCRRIAGVPPCRMFKPAGVPTSQLERVVLSLDELEAIRLADRDGLYQEQAAAQMDVSRQTFGRIVASGRRKVAEALVEAKVLQIEGGQIVMAAARQFKCSECEHTWALAYGTGRPQQCPQCGSAKIHRVQDEGGSTGAGCGGGQRRRRRVCQRRGAASHSSGGDSTSTANLKESQQ